MKNKFFGILFIIISLGGFPALIRASSDSLYMIVPSGQIAGQVFKVFVPDRVVTSDMGPKLILKTSFNGKDQYFKPDVVASNQVITESIDGNTYTRSGTLMLFNIHSLHIPFFSTTLRVIPILVWQEKDQGKEIKLVHSSYYFLGNGTGTTIWTVITLVLVLILIGVLLIRKNRKGQILGIICDADGSVSMSLLQMLIWTVAVGLTVLAFGLLRLDVPNIPGTLIMLMLFAAGTSTAGHIQSKMKLRKEGQLETERTKRGLKTDKGENKGTNTFWGKFSTVFYTNKDSEYPSMAKVQVLFWTIVTLILFVVLSIKEGKLWEVPEQLVVLMGISQATFLSRQQMAIQDVKDKIKDLPNPPSQADKDGAGMETGNK